MSLTQPVLNAVAFAVNSAHINQIPISTTEHGAASFLMGFPYETMVNKLAGGVPPSGEDFNGIFNYLSKHQVWLNAGGTYKFNETLATALGGYQQGAILASNDGLRLYVSTVDGNKTDLNSDMTGWKLIGTSELQTLLDTLQTNIDQERGWRETADADLLQRIGWESDARITNDNALQANIDQERGWRETADADLLQRIGWESDARITADNNERDARIQGDNNERDARIAGDNVLSDRVTILENAPPLQVIGVGQSIVDVKSNRAANTTYWNTTGRAIEVSIVVRAYHDGGNQPVNLYVNTIFRAGAQCDVGPGGWIVSTLSSIVPDGSNYRINSGEVVAWTELR